MNGDRYPFWLDEPDDEFTSDACDEEWFEIDDEHLDALLPEEQLDSRWEEFVPL